MAHQENLIMIHQWCQLIKEIKVLWGIYQWLGEPSEIKLILKESNLY